MGNLIKSTDQYQQQLFSIIKTSENGLSFLLEKKSGKQFLLKQFNSNAEEDNQKIFRMMMQKKSLQHQHILKIKDVFKKIQSTLCSNLYKIFVIIEHPFRTLLQEIQDRIPTQNYFKQCEIWSIIYSCALGLKYLYEEGIRHESLSNQRIFIDQEGLIQICDPNILGYEVNPISILTRNSKDQHIYLSPEQIQLSNNPKLYYSPQVSDIFTLGLIILQCLNLKFMDQIFEPSFTKIYTQKLKNQIQKSQVHYSNKLIHILQKMLKIKPSQRITLTQIQIFIQTSSFTQENTNTTQMNLSIPIVQQKKKLTQLKRYTYGNNNNANISLTSQRNSNLGRNSEFESNKLSNAKTYITQYQKREENINSKIYSSNPGTQSFNKTIIRQSFQPMPRVCHNQQFNNQLRKRVSFQHNEYPTVVKYQKKQLQNIANIFYNQPNSTKQNISYPRSNYNEKIYNQNKYTIPYLFPEKIQNQQQIRVGGAINYSNYNSNRLPHQQKMIVTNQKNLKMIDPIRQVKNFNYSAGQIFNNNYIQRNEFQYCKTLETKNNQNYPNLTVNNVSQKIQNLRDLTPEMTRYIQPNSTIAQVTQNQLSTINSLEKKNQLVYENQEYQYGSRYQGYKLNGLRHGFGKFYYQDGGFYQGQWKENKMDGYAKLYYQNGQLAYQGYWKNDMFHGRGKVFNDNIKKIDEPFDYYDMTNLDQFWVYYDGMFQEDIKHGEGTIKFSNGQIFEGYFQKDIIKGQGKYFTLNGDVISGIWQDNHFIKNL